MGIKVSQMPSTNTLTDNDLIMVVQDNENKKINKKDLQNNLTDPSLTKKVEELENENAYLQKVIDQLPQVTGQGTSITLENTIEAPFTKFEIKGNSTQDGTPSPDNEVPIKSAGENGSINEKIKNADGTEEQDYSIPVQQPMMDDDYFDRKNNKEVHTWIKYVLDGSDDENWSIRNNKFFINDNVNYNLWEREISPNGKSNIGVVSFLVLDNQTGFGLALAYGIRLNLENINAASGGTVEQLRTYLAEHPITIYVKLKEGAYEKLPCTEEQIQQLENLPSTYKDFTIIQSQDTTPAYLEVSGIYDLNNLINN